MVKKKIVEGQTVGLECALGCQGYCSFISSEFLMCIYPESLHFPGTPTIVGVAPLNMPTEDELIEKDGVIMTNPYRSVIDIINFNPHSEYSVQAVGVMLESEDEMRKMYAKAKKYGMVKELEELIQETREIEY